MREIEDALRGAPLVKPPARLGARLDTAFAWAETGAASWWRLRVPLWACGVAVLTCGALGFLAHAALTPQPPQTVYILPVDGEWRRMLTGETPKPPEPEGRALRVTVTPLSRKSL